MRKLTYIKLMITCLLVALVTLPAYLVVNAVAEDICPDDYPYHKGNSCFQDASMTGRRISDVHADTPAEVALMSLFAIFFIVTLVLLGCVLVTSDPPEDTLREAPSAEQRLLQIQVD